MAALALRLGRLPVELVGRFTTELPFLWEIIPFKAWRDAIVLSREQCFKWYGETVGSTMFREHADRRIQAFTASNHSLRALLEAARVWATGELTKDVQLARRPTMDAVFAAQLFQGENCRVQQLLRNNAEAEWPEGLMAEVNVSAATTKYLCPVEYAFRDSVINAPIVLSLYAITGDGADWLARTETVAGLRAHHAFDPDWFADAFDLTVARCLATNLLKLEM
jgi:hypothetical protein